MIDAGARHLVVDLRRVSFIDSMGLGVLVGARRRLLPTLGQDAGHVPGDGSIELVCAEGLIVRILRLTGLDRVFPLHASVADALGGDAGHAGDRTGDHSGSGQRDDQASGPA